MTEAKQQTEPSMEEILASIRRIISEDAEAGKSPPAASPEAAAPVPEAPATPPPAAPAADVLELTEMVAEDDKVPEPPPSQAETAPKSEAVPPAPPQEQADETLISSQTAAAAANALSGLAAADRLREPEQRNSLALGNGAATLEDLVRAELRPILKAWLDENLPGIVERLVQKEIQLITRRIDAS